MDALSPCGCLDRPFTGHAQAAREHHAPRAQDSRRRTLSRINKKAIEDGRKRRAATPTQAKHFVTTMRQMFMWAIAADPPLARSDPTAGITFKRSKKDDTNDGFPVWSDDDVEKFERRWPRGTREQVLFDIYQFTGLRRGDASDVGKQHVRKGVISIRTEKTGMLVTIPILPELQKTLDAGPLGELSWFARLDGKPMVKGIGWQLFR